MFVLLQFTNVLQFETGNDDPPMPPTPVILPQALGAIPFHYGLDDDDGYIGEDEYNETVEWFDGGVEGEEGEDMQEEELGNEEPVTILARIVRQYQYHVLMFLLWIFSIV